MPGSRRSGCPCTVSHTGASSSALLVSSTVKLMSAGKLPSSVSAATVMVSSAVRGWASERTARVTFLVKVAVHSARGLSVVHFQRQGVLPVEDLLEQGFLAQALHREFGAGGHVLADGQRHAVHLFGDGHGVSVAVGHGVGHRKGCVFLAQRRAAGSPTSAGYFRRLVYRRRSRPCRCTASPAG